MSNLKHGFYSTNTNINPDCVMMRNAQVKEQLRINEQNIIDVVQGKIVKPGVTDLIAYLIDCALPHNEHLLPRTHIQEIYSYYHSKAFSSLRKHAGSKSLTELVATVDYFS